MNKVLKIGTRDSQLAVWQASLVKDTLTKYNISSELVYIKSEGDLNLVTPLYKMGVQGIFTRTLDAALLSSYIDVAVHSMKDVPVQLAQGIAQAAVLPRGSYKDILVFKDDKYAEQLQLSNLYHNSRLGDRGFTIATSSIRRKAQWLRHYPNTTIENLRGNVNTRLRKLHESNWNGAIFAAAGLERIHLRPENSVDLNWMLPAPAQGAIMVVCKETDADIKQACFLLNDENTALCTKIERDFLEALMGGCSTPISALAEVKNDIVYFKGSVVLPDGSEEAAIERNTPLHEAENLGTQTGEELLHNGAQKIIEALHHAKYSN